MNERLTDIEVALAFDRKQLDELNDALVEAHREIDALKLRIARMESMLQGLADQLEGAPANEKPPHY